MNKRGRFHIESSPPHHRLHYRAASEQFLKGSRSILTIGSVIELLFICLSLTLHFTAPPLLVLFIGDAGLIGFALILYWFLTMTYGTIFIDTDANRIIIARKPLPFPKQSFDVNNISEIRDYQMPTKGFTRIAAVDSAGKAHRLLVGDLTPEESRTVSHIIAGHVGVPHTIKPCSFRLQMWGVSVMLVYLLLILPSPF